MRIFSPRFHFKDKKCYFYVCPNGSESEEWFQLGLIIYSNCESWQMRLGINGHSGEHIESSYAERQDCLVGNAFNVDRFIQSTRLLEEEAQLVPNGNLTIFCEVVESAPHLCVAQALQTESQNGK